MRIVSMAAAAALMPLLAGCIVISSDKGETVSVMSTDHGTDHGQALEPLSRINFDGQKMTVVVGSNGCTQTSSFEVHIQDTTPTEISLVRSTPDLCRAIVAEGVSLSWTYEELGLKAGQAVKILNPLVG